jgi:DNA-binding CsgD family transcriptional regulator
MEDLRKMRKYMSITSRKKRELVALVNTGITIKEASVRLDLNYSTSKHIIKIFKKLGFHRST